MKKNTVKLFVLAIALGSSLVVSAQEMKRSRAFKDNVVESKMRAEKFSIEDAAREKEVTEFARLNNLPMEIRKDNVYMRLTYVRNGEPIYTKTFNEETAITSRVDKLHPNGSSGLGLTGRYYDNPDANADPERINIGVWDGEYPKVTHPEFTGRFFPIDGPANNPQDHPTHVLGTLIATGIDADAKGMAYEGFGMVANFANDFGEMALNAGSLVLSNHSYGLAEPNNSVTGVYFGGFAKRVDQITFDHPYYQPVFAAGNEGDGTYDNLTDRGLAKNGITVAAINKLNWVDLNTPQIASFSNWGPADDNRIKPDISAAGVNIYSTMAHLPVNPVDYDKMSGTSMACPSITGALALIQQYYAIQHTPADDIGFSRTYMLSSSLRALMAHCATEAGAVGPDAKFGWGVINAEKMADVITKEGTESMILENTLTLNQEYTLEVEALGSEPLVVTLAWTDPAPNISDCPANDPFCSSASIALVNDLDITVVKGSTINYPWKLTSNPASLAIKGNNSVDNIEKVEVANASGTYTIKIKHKGNTLVNPANPSQQQQVYSLVVTGVDSPLAAGDFTKDSFSVWPNPAQDRLNISMASSLENGANATVYDIQGRVVLVSKISAADTELNIESLNTGVYMVKVVNGNKTDVKKFIVK
ncbi:S8 family serine peptidase [Flavobacterium hauense]